MKGNKSIDLSKYENQWVALSHDEKRVVANHENLQKAVEEANRIGEKHPVVIKAPSKCAGYIL